MSVTLTVRAFGVIRLRALYCRINARSLSPILQWQCGNGHTSLSPTIFLSSHQHVLQPYSNLHVHWYSTDESESKKLSKRQESRGNLKRIIREYGVVAILFHTGMSLCVLSTCYLIVRSGVDVENFLKYFNIDASRYKTASTFAVSYIVYKITLPIRATVTVTSVPFIVRYLRARGIMKPPPQQSKKIS